MGAMIAAGAVLAATHVQHPRELWNVALIAVIALAVLGIATLTIGGIAAFLTRPVPPDHATAIRASAQALSRSLESDRVCDYGDGYKPDQAFRVHFKQLATRLAAWDAAVAAPAATERDLDQQIDTMMAEHGIPDPEAGYNVPRIKGYAHAVAIEHANGRLLEAPHFEWGGFTTAGHREIPGPPYGVLKPNDSETDWVSLTPLDGESEADWLARIEPYTQRVDALMAAVYASALPYAQAVSGAEDRLREFKQDALPDVLDALQLVEVREAPRVRHRCESC